MAYAALVSLAQTLDQVLIGHSFVVHDHEKQQIQSLHEKIVFLSTFLEDFPREATNLEARIRVAANLVQDILELHISNKILGSKYVSVRSSPLALPSPLNSLKKLYRHYLNKVAMKEIDSILKEAMEMKSGCSSENQIMSSSSTLPVLNVQGPVVGFEKELREIQERLHGESAKLEVIPIVGMGGIGKTTLARYALHDPLSLEHFDVCGWVTVSQSYDKASILLRLLNSIDASNKQEDFPNESSMLQEHIYKYLKGRRFLIVVDDIWSGNTWDDLRRVFPDDFNGSRIIITTRDTDVASYVDSFIHPYEMHLMGVDSSWNLLRQKVFGEERCPPKLERIGRQIAEKCRGLPLAIVVIAGVLSKVDRMQETWIKIAKNVNEVVNTSDEPFTEILSLSYTWLPHHLRPCFLYMGGFPEDHEIHVSKLSRMWVAEGFLKSNGSKVLEEVGEDYLEELAKRSLVLVVKKRYNGRIKTIKMHDLLRDFCLRKAHDEKFLRVIQTGSLLPIQKSRRISFLSGVKDPFMNMDYSPIRTILAFNNTTFGSWKWKRCRLLRVMDLKVGRLSTEDDDKIGELLHLRYVATTFEGHEIAMAAKVPEYFSKFVNLQTLIIRRTRRYIKVRLPLGIWRMRELRHVIVDDGFLPDPSTETCDHISPLQNLQTLKIIRHFRCSERILELIPNLKKLRIIHLERDTGSDITNLIHLHKLEKLDIYGKPCKFFKGLHSHHGLAFPVTLKKLTLRDTQIPWEYMSIVGSLPNLQVLKLTFSACDGSKWETVEGQFCQLKVLVIVSEDLEFWETESCHFPMLERLAILFCDKLSQIPCDIGDIPTLQLIELSSCNSCVVESAKRIEQLQLDSGNDFQLHIY